MEVLNLITRLENKLKAYLCLRSDATHAETWRLDVQLFYEEEPAGRTTFTLHGYSQDEAETIARGIKHNEYLMHEIDQVLWGESD
ncbi:hypothetical protein [Stutzerimonas tarimensis]|uniref:Uncharacterized protein n=1 Tax=Stutzerimonas tarimensis TaxID=1507735 RepID=A0ABV7T0A3_9GAMM